MFRPQIIRSLVSVGRMASKAVVHTRNKSSVVPRIFAAVNSSFISTPLSQTSRRYFSDEMLSSTDIMKRIDACGMNDAGKEKIIEQEVKKKNFVALRQAGEDMVMNSQTKELGILCFVQAADAGDMLSQFAVGNLYLQRYWQEKMKPESDVKTRDNLIEKTEYWYELASKQGHIPSKVGLAKVYLEDPTVDNVHKAITIYEETEKLNNVDAIYNLGFIYYEGLYNTEKDRFKGFNYLTRAAELGDVSACYFLGFSYHKGLFENDNPNARVPTTSAPEQRGACLCDKDMKKCIEYLERACQGGHSKAMIYLYQMYHNGDGVEKDIRLSSNYLIKAMRTGDPEALFIRGNQMYCGDDGVEINKEMALKLFLDAGERGNADAMCSAGAMIYNGEGQERDLKKAFDVYTNAASLGSLPAIKNIASMYLLGEGVEKDVETAKNLMQFIEEEEKKYKDTMDV